MNIIINSKIVSKIFLSNFTNYIIKNYVIVSSKITSSLVQKVCQKYNNAFRNISGLKIPQTDFSNISPFIYSLRILNGKRENMIKHLQDLDIEVGIHFIPVHKHKYFQDCKKSKMNVTEKITKEVLTLPLHSNMKEDFINRIIHGVTSYFN